MSVESPSGPVADLSVDRLLGADQTWIEAARRALADPGSKFLSADMVAALSQDTHRLRDGDDPMAWRSVWELVAIPLNDLLADLSHGRATRDSLNDLLETFEKHGLVSIHGTGRPSDPSARWAEADVRHQATALNAATSPLGSGAFAAILIHVLTAGDADRRLTTSVSMPVLLHNEANARIGRPAGEVGTLTLTRWRDGPPGFHPDPRLMTFSTVDADALDAIQQAWLGSPHDSRGTCVTWAIRDKHDFPVRRLQGSSLAAALALLLRELSSRRGARAAAWRLRPRRLRANWTVTAGLRDRRLTRVSHYETKLEAAASLTKPLHVAVAPRPDQVHDRGDDPVLAVGQRLALDVRVIETYEALSRATRTLNRGFVLGVAGAMVVAATTAGMSVRAQQAVNAANLEADKRTTATELMQQSRSLIDQDSRLSALTALAADDLDPSLRTSQLMADVLAANTTVVGSATISSSYIRDMVVSHDTLLVLDGEDTVTAWSLPGFQPLGTVIEDDVSGLGEGGPGDVVIMKNADLHIFHTAAGYAPREVDIVSTGLSGRATVFGPYTDVNGGVVAIDEDFNGVYYDNGMKRPFAFSVGDNTTIEADSRRTSTAIIAATNGTSSDPHTEDGVSEIDGITVATSARQVLDIGIQRHYEGRPRPEAVVRSVMTSNNAKAAIRAVSDGPNGTILLGTDRGVQQWDPDSYETVEFPYGGWSDQVDEIFYDYGPIAVMSKQRIGFFDEPVDDRPRESPTIVDLGGSVFTTIDGGSVSVGSTRSGVSRDRMFVGREDGTVSMLDPSNSRFGPGSINGSNMQEFTPSDHLIQTVGDTAQRTNYLYTQQVPERAADQMHQDPAEDPYSDYDPYQRTYTLPETNGLKPYINEAAASDDWIAAAGRRSDGMGAWWVWPLAGGTYAQPTEVPFGYGESGEDPVPDIVSQIEFVDGGRQIAALNGAKGELGFWSVGDWKKVGSVTFPIPKDFDTSGAMRLVAAGDGRTVAVRDSDTTVTIVDTETHEVRRRIDLPEAQLTDVTLSPDGRHLAVTDHLRTIRVLDATVGQGKILASDEQTSVVNALEFDPSGDRLALGFATASTVEVIDSHTLEPLGPPWQANDGYRVIDVAWSPDGDLLSVGTLQFQGERAVNGATEILDPTTLTWHEQLCQMATSNFTDDEWHRLSGSDLATPNSCDWTAGANADPSSEALAPPPSDTGDLTLPDLMAGAPVPEMCGHNAGDLVLGHLPGQAPNTGDVYLSDTAFGDLTGDGVADAVADIECNAGGVGWPSTIAAYTRAADGSALLLGTISAADTAIVGPQGSERPGVLSVAIEDGSIVADVLANTEGDPACCGTLPVHLEMTAGMGGIDVVRADRHYEMVVVNKLVNGISSSVSTGVEYVDTTDTPTDVIDAITEMNATYVGVEVGECTALEGLSDDLATRVSVADAADPAVQYCTVVAAPAEEAKALLLRLRQVDDERWRVTDLIP